MHRTLRAVIAAVALTLIPAANAAAAPYASRTLSKGASGSDVDRTRAFEAFADDYFVKPFSPIALLDKVYALLG